MRFIYLIFITLISTNCIAQPMLEWAISSNTSTSEYESVIRKDIFNNIYVVGSSTIKNTNPSLNDANIFIRKLNSNGTAIWTKYFGDSGGDSYVKDVDIDSLGNLFITGYFKDTEDFDPSINTYYLSSDNGSYDIYILKLDSNGNFIWANSIGSYGSDYGNAIELDKLGNCYLVGKFIGPVDFDSGFNTNYLVAPSMGNMFILKIDTAGNFVWANAIGGVNRTEAYDITFDNSGNPCITGLFVDTVDFDTGPSIYNLFAQNNFDIFILKLDPNGNFGWVKSANSTSNSSGYVIGKSIITDFNGDLIVSGDNQESILNIPILGDTIQVLDSSGNKNTFILKIRDSGEYVWAKMFRSIGNYSYSESFSSSSDNSGDVYTCGSFVGSIDFNPGMLSVTNDILNSGSDVYIQKMDADGNFIWVKTIGGSNSETLRSIYVDQNNDIYSCGEFISNYLDVDPSANIFNVSHSANSEWDLFFFKWNQCLSDITVIDTTITDTAYITPSGNDTLIYSGTYIDILPNASQNGCDSLVKINLISNIVGIDEILNTNEIESVIYPNPTSSQLTIIADLDIHEINIHDITGKLIKRINHNTNNINVANLSNGVYFIKLVTDEGTITKKFVKQ